MKEQQENINKANTVVVVDSDGYVVSHKYQVVFVDEYNNWYLIGFFNDLHDAEPFIRDFLNGYEFEDDGELSQEELLERACHLEEYPSTFSTCFDKCIDTTCGCVEVRGFIY